MIVAFAYLSQFASPYLGIWNAPNKKKPRHHFNGLCRPGQRYVLIVLCSYCMRAILPKHLESDHSCSISPSSLCKNCFAHWKCVCQRERACLNERRF